MTNRDCAHCEERFTPRHYAQRYCDVTCRNQARYLRSARREKIVASWQGRNCATCNEVFDATDNRQKYCGVSCRHKAHNRTKREKRRALIHRIKMKSGCVDCGYRDNPYALEFDHLPGTDKSFTVARGRDRAPAGELMNEIEKCEVVCANCHRIRTAERGQYSG